uniref:transposase n=1 Tax=Arthrobacter sp. Hiyo1 TaxID=1588020 RepID=UPI00209BCC79|nr:transposase [Arthrobacter sp. Hiyo1]
MEAYLHGVSTRKVDDLVKALGADVDGVPVCFPGRHLLQGPGESPGRVPRGRGRVRGRADGRREVLGFDVGDSENEGFWTAFLRSLKTRGLDGVKLVISDAHTGLKKAIDTVFQGAGLAALPDPLHAKEKPGTACAAESPFPSTSGSKAAPKGDEAGRPRPQ